MGAKGSVERSTGPFRNGRGSATEDARQRRLQVRGVPPSDRTSKKVARDAQNPLPGRTDHSHSAAGSSTSTPSRSDTQRAYRAIVDAHALDRRRPLHVPGIVAFGWSVGSHPDLLRSAPRRSLRRRRLHAITARRRAARDSRHHQGVSPAGRASSPASRRRRPLGLTRGQCWPRPTTGRPGQRLLPELRTGPSGRCGPAGVTSWATTPRGPEDAVHGRRAVLDDLVQAAATSMTGRYWSDSTVMLLRRG